MSLREVTARATRVSVGRIDRITSYRDVSSGRIISRVQVVETHAVSGSPAPSFSFEMVGGTFEGVREWIAGFPSVEVGDRVVLFLAQDTATPFGPTVGLWQGVYYVDTDPASGVETVTDHARRPVSEIRGDNAIVMDNSARGTVRAAQPHAQRVTLNTFLERIRTWRSAR